jgi:hypothetical protein
MISEKFMSKTESDRLKKLEIWWVLRDVGNKIFTDKTITWGDNEIGCKIELTPEFPQICLAYVITDYAGNKKEVKYGIPLEKTECNYGSYRYWFTCPLYKNGDNRRCNRRVGVLYMAGDYFGCRHCYELTYSSRNENKHYVHFGLLSTVRLHAKMDKLWLNMKRYYWRGQPTKKYRKYLRLQAILEGQYEALKQAGEL